MFEKIFDFGGEIVHVMGRLNRTEWLVIMLAALAIGTIFLRGYGSRKTY